MKKKELLERIEILEYNMKKLCYIIEMDIQLKNQKYHYIKPTSEALKFQR